MKVFLLLLVTSLFLLSCGLEQDLKITTKFLHENYSEEFHELNLSNKELIQIPNFEKYLTGSYIDNVWSIDLSNNSIEDINGEYFKYFPNLKEINLSYNKIENITLELNFLQELKIHKNNLKKVNLDANPKLNTLNLGYNELLSGKDILLPKSIKTLELQHNKLTDLVGLGELDNLGSLKVEFNELENSDLKELENLKMLKFISVGQNKISKELEEKINEMNNKENK